MAIFRRNRSKKPLAEGIITRIYTRGIDDGKYDMRVASESSALHLEMSRSEALVIVRWIIESEIMFGGSSRKSIEALVETAMGDSEKRRGHGR